jgi:hypothetical protein
MVWLSIKALVLGFGKLSPVMRFGETEKNESKG